VVFDGKEGNISYRALHSEGTNWEGSEQWVYVSLRTARRPWCRADSTEEGDWKLCSQSCRVEGRMQISQSLFPSMVLIVARDFTTRVSLQWFKVVSI
jgi:hypothetical protein